MGYQINEKRKFKRNIYFLYKLIYSRMGNLYGSHTMNEVNRKYDEHDKILNKNKISYW